MFGLGPEEKELQQVMKKAGANMRVVNDWLRTLERIRKNSRNVLIRYQNALDSTRAVEDLLVHVEEFLKDSEADYDNARRKMLQGWLKEIKKLSGQCDHTFVVSVDDREFHLTYETILSLGAKYSGASEDRLIFLSEIENLLFLVRENLEKEHPDLIELCFFYLSNTDEELLELPPAERIRQVHQLFEHEFLDDMRKQIILCMKQAREKMANGVNEPWMQVLFRKAVAYMDLKQQAEALLMEYCHL